MSDIDKKDDDGVKQNIFLDIKNYLNDYKGVNIWYHPDRKTWLKFAFSRVKMMLLFVILATAIGFYFNNYSNAYCEDGFIEALKIKHGGTAFSKCVGCDEIVSTIALKQKEMKDAWIPLTFTLMGLSSMTFYSILENKRTWFKWLSSLTIVIPMFYILITMQFIQYVSQVGCHFF